MDTHHKAKHCYGGVYIILRYDLINNYIFIIGKECDGVLAIYLQYKRSSLPVLIVGLYLPPENSKLGRDSRIKVQHNLNRM